MSESFSFIFSGELKEGADAQDVKTKLAASFGMPVEKVDTIFTGQPVVIKRGLNKEEAERYRQTFAEAGAPGEIRAEADRPAAEATPQQKQEPPTVQQSPVKPTDGMSFPCGFWRRSFAFLIDGLIIGIPGWVIGLLYFDELVRLGQAGRLIGFAIALSYFGLLNSSIAGGQTLGKRLLKIRVVDLKGDTIPVHRSALRYLVLSLPFFCNNLSIDLQNGLLVVLFGVIVFGLGGSTLYLYLFNRKNRRSVHDYAAGTLVVDAPQGTPHFMPAWRGHFIILAVLLVGIFTAAGIFVPSLKKQEPFAELLTIQEVLQKEDGIHSVGVQSGQTLMGESSTHWFAINVIVANPDLNPEATANHFATLVLTRESTIEEKDLLVVNISRGFDIGISSGWKSDSYRYTPTQWRARLGLGQL